MPYDLLLLPFRRPLVLAILVAATCGGCVQRRMTIRSNPPGAQVYIDDQEIGRTPVSTDYTYYGARKVRLVKDGYETLTVKQPIWAPWYEWPGLAFVSENIWPWEIRDERTFDYAMQPAMVVPSQSLLARGEELRRSQVVAAPAATSTVVVPQPEAVPVQPTPVYTPQPPSVYAPPPALLNYPPSEPPAGYVPAQPIDAPTSLPGDFGGRPVPAIP